MLRRDRLKRLAVFTLVAAVASLSMHAPAHAAGNGVSPSRSSVTTLAIGANDLRPPQCTGKVTRVITGTGTFAGSSGADLLLGSAAIDAISGTGGNDCIVAGGGDDTLNGGNGTDTCLGGSGSNTFLSCETKL